MIDIEVHCFNPFSENTYILRSGNEVAVIDPGCIDQGEEQRLTEAIGDGNLKSVWLTHSHLDHVLGLPFLFEHFGLAPLLHAADKPTWELYEKSAAVWGVPIKGELPIPAGYFAHGDTLQLGDDTLEVRWVPGHSPGHVVFVNYKQQWVIGGDVLFNGSVGRTDLPGGDFATLEAAIQRELYSLPDEFKVFCGHGPATTIGDEKRKNPFVRG